jgi:hypothetical protein
MPLAASALIAAIAALVSFFMKVLTKRIAVMLAVTVVMTAITTAFVLAMKLLIAGVVVAVPDEMVVAAGWFMPDNVHICAAAIVSAHLLRWAFDWQIGIAKAKLWVT